MTQTVYVSRLNPKTTQLDFERFCTRFGQVIECVIFPENDKLSKRSGYVKFASCHSAEKMYRQSREETLYIDQTSIDIELCRDTRQSSKEKHKQHSNMLWKKFSHSPTIYTLNIKGQIMDEEELIKYFNSKPLSVKFDEITNNTGQVIKTGAQVTFNDKDLVDRILIQNHEKYTIKLLSNNVSIKREHDFDESLTLKRSKPSQSTYASITAHLESLTKLTQDMHEENEHLKTEKSLLTTTLHQQLTKIKQTESEKADLIESSTKTHEITKCLTSKYKLREDEHRTTLEESNKKLRDLENILATTNETLSKAVNEIQRLKNQLTQLTEKYTQSKVVYLEQQHDIEHFFCALKKNFI